MDRKRPNVITNMTSDRQKLPSILKGRVVSVNDPQQEGRLLVHFSIIGSQLSDAENNTSVDHYKWIQYAPMYGGESNGALRGPAKVGQGMDDSGDVVEGNVGYGFWAIPSKGATVFCFVANDDINEIYWFACKYPPKSSSTLFNGKYIEQGGSIDGPFAHNGSPAEPLHSNQKSAFGGINYEWLSRAATYNPGAILDGEIGVKLHPMKKPIEANAVSSTSADINENDGTVVGRHMKYVPGYARSRTEPSKDTTSQHEIDRSRATPQNAESTMVGLSTPAGGTINFDDRPESCRSLFRSVTGHSVLLDDTNDRIYVATNKGKTWLEMDSNGHVFLYAEESLSFRSQQYVNITADKQVRLMGKEGIHLCSPDGDVRVDANDIHLKAQDGIFGGANNVDFTTNAYTVKTSNYSVGTNTYAIKTGTFSVDGSSVQIKGSSVNLQGSSVNIKGSGMYEGISKGFSPGATAPAASVTAPAEPTEPELAFWTNITPTQEPWARTFNGSKDQLELFDHTPEFGYDDPNVNRDMKQTSSDYQRGPLWRR